MVGAAIAHKGSVVERARGKAETLVLWKRGGLGGWSRSNFSRRRRALPLGEGSKSSERGGSCARPRDKRESERERSFIDNHKVTEGR